MGLGKKLGEMAVIQSVKAVLEHFGVWPFVAGILIAVGSSLWTWAARQPLSVIALTSFSAGIAATYAVLLPAVLRLLMAGRIYPKVDIRPWRKAPSLALFQVACIMAGIEPKLPVPPPARGWLHTLMTNAQQGKLKLEVAGAIYSSSYARVGDLRSFVEAIGEKWPLA
jgi:uncharacterized membrane protein YcfT